MILNINLWHATDINRLHYKYNSKKYNANDAIDALISGEYEYKATFSLQAENIKDALKTIIENTKDSTLPFRKIEIGDVFEVGQATYIVASNNEFDLLQVRNMRLVTS